MMNQPLGSRVKCGEYVVAYIELDSKRVYCVFSIKSLECETLISPQSDKYINNSSVYHFKIGLGVMLSLKILESYQHNTVNLNKTILSNMCSTLRITNKQCLYKYIQFYIGKSIPKCEVYFIVDFLPEYKIDEYAFSVRGFIDHFVLKRDPYYIIHGTFLDNFYRDDNKDKQQYMLNPEPVYYPFLSHYNYAYIAGMTEKLAHDYKLIVPKWTEKPLYFMQKMETNFKPYKTGIIQEILDCPEEFRRRNIMVSYNVLSRL